MLLEGRRARIERPETPLQCLQFLPFSMPSRLIIVMEGVRIQGGG